MGKYAQGWRAIMRAETRRRNRRVLFGLGAVAAGVFGVVMVWPW